MEGTVTIHLRDFNSLKRQAERLWEKLDEIEELIDLIEDMDKAILSTSSNLALRMRANNVINKYKEEIVFERRI